MEDKDQIKIRKVLEKYCCPYPSAAAKELIGLGYIRQPKIRIGEPQKRPDLVFPEGYYTSLDELKVPPADKGELRLKGLFMVAYGTGLKNEVPEYDKWVEQAREILKLIDKGE